MQMEKDGYYPHYAVLEVTKKCNMKCLHCGSSADTKDRDNALSLKEWYRVIDDLKTLGAQHITLSGGEPFMHPNWRDIVRKIREGNKANANFISNGSNISEDDIIFMKEFGVTHVALSIDGTESVHDKIRRTPGAYKKVMETISLCNKYGLNATIATSVNKMNFNCLQDLLQEISKLKIKVWQIQIVNSFGRAGELKDQMILTHEQYAQLCENIYKWKKGYASKLLITGADSIGYCDSGIIDEMLDGAEWEGCNAGICNIGIESNGTVKGCLSLQDDRFIAGNVKESSLIDIWNDDNNFSYTRLYDHSNMKGSCKGCDKAEMCKAGCLGIAYSIHNNIYENSYCYKHIRDL